MKKRKIKNEISKEFPIPVPERKKEFLRNYKFKQNSSISFVCGQIRYISWKIWALSILLLLPIVYGAYIIGVDTVIVISSFVPFLALMLITESSKSIIYKMNEIEMASRFSLKSVVSARMIILGIFDMFLFCIFIPICRKIDNISFIRVGLYLFVPYLMTAFAGMKIVRYLHNRETVNWCFGTAVAVSSINIILRYNAEHIFHADKVWCWEIAAVILLLADIKDTYVTFRKEDESIWNYALTD